MRKHSNARRVKLFRYTQDSGKWHHWHYRWITRGEADALLSAGEAKEVKRMLDGAVRTVGLQALKPAAIERPSPTTLTEWTMQVVGKQAAGCRLTGREREEMCRFRVWPLIGDTKAVAVRPRISAEERRHAEHLLGGRAA